MSDYKSNKPKKKFYPMSMNDMSMRFNGRMISGSKRPANAGFSFMPTGVRFGGWWNHDAVDKGSDPYFIITYDLFRDFLLTVKEFAATPGEERLLKTFTLEYYDKKAQSFVDKEDSLNVLRMENGVICFSWKSTKQRYPSIVFEMTRLGGYKTHTGVGDSRRELTDAEYSRRRVKSWVENVEWLLSHFNPAGKEDSNDATPSYNKSDGNGEDFNDDFGF